MAGVIHAAALVTLVVVTAIACVRDRRRPGSLRVIVAALGAATYAAATVLVTLHNCGLGQPLAQWAVPAACMGAVLMFVRSARLRRVLAMTITAAGLALSFHYVGEVHGPAFVGVAAPDAHYGIAGTRRQWHTWLTGLYRRVPASSSASSSSPIQRVSSPKAD